MKFTSTLISLLATDDGCPENYSPRCYCSGPDITNQNCDVTQRITITSMNTVDSCASYCTEQCGEMAGSQFSCYPEDDDLKISCDGDPDRGTCKCSCDHNVAVPSSMAFSDQCAAFCDRQDVCGDVGSEFSCGGTSGASSTFGWNEVIAMTASIGAAALALF